MTMIDPVTIGPDAVTSLVAYCEAQGLRRFTLISDANTFRALGQRVEAALKQQGYDVATVVLDGKEVVADAHYILEALMASQIGATTYLAVGSGTVTDITRFISYRTGNAFISLPTAPSVDGFTSIGAPLILRGVKRTLLCQAPTALFGDLQTLTEAPHALVAAGYGDMVGKVTSVADWRLGSVVWGERYDAAVHQQFRAAIESCLAATPEVGKQSPEGVTKLLETLVESGFGMLAFGNSNPASGAEHHSSHYWEMLLLQEGRPALLHGAKVGYATIQVARQYAKLRAMSRQELLDRLEASTLPDRDAEIAIIRQGFPTVADEVISDHKPFLDMTQEQYDQLKQRIADCWDSIQEIAADVPPPEVITEYLDVAGAPTTTAALGLSEDEIKLGFKYGHYLRQRFSIMKLSRVLGLPMP